MAQRLGRPPAYPTTAIQHRASKLTPIAPSTPIERSISRNVPVAREQCSDFQLQSFLHGLALLRWIRTKKELRLIPVVVLTNSADATDVRSAYEAGANSYLLKPANREEIYRVVEVIQHYWLEHNVAPPLVLRASNP